MTIPLGRRYHLHVVPTSARIDSGERKDAWCFACRARHPFAFVVTHPDSGFYGPTGEWIGLACGRAGTDRFGAGLANPRVSFEPAGTPVPRLSPAALEGYQ